MGMVRKPPRPDENTSRNRYASSPRKVSGRSKRVHQAFRLVESAGHFLIRLARARYKRHFRTAPIV